MRLLHDYMLLRKEPSAEKTSGGIIIPADARAEAGSLRAQREPKIGRVLSVGNGRRSKRGNVQRVEVRTGDRVLMDPLAELIEADPCDPLLRYAVEFQCAGVLE